MKGSSAILQKEVNFGCNQRFHRNDNKNNYSSVRKTKSQVGSNRKNIEIRFFKILQPLGGETKDLENKVENTQYKYKMNPLQVVKFRVEEFHP